MYINCRGALCVANIMLSSTPYKNIHVKFDTASEIVE